ncbi:four-carbon acid sugar kinase family protein [Alphaproteobacteria bacterium]|nr:four-carbon acid sugar kinase family protein [bacterium]MDB4599964.1 four-carbon acid sugar kinase family protein [Alphaproteobacteria bacterium]
MLLGCIGDDFTGSSDLANTLAKAGMAVVQYSGVPSVPADASVEAGVIALKSRSIPAAEAIKQSLAALKWLQNQGCKQFFFKYCSTFDSTDDGNIGPVAEALASALVADAVIVCPAFPRTGRTVFQGHLFVKDQLLSDSPMKDHPLTPMCNPDLRNVLSRQSCGVVGHVPMAIVAEGSDAIRDALAAEARHGRNLIVVDAIHDDDLIAIGAAARDLVLITGGSGVAMGLPANFVKTGQILAKKLDWQGQAGRCAILSGSCSEVTRNQIATHAKTGAQHEIDVAGVMRGEVEIDGLLSWFLAQDGLPILYSSASPTEVQHVQAEFGMQAIADRLDNLFGDLAIALVAAGVERLIVAGGETAGAVVGALRLNALSMGPEIDPGVPAMRVGSNLTIALKSGNFGTDNFFEKAATILAGGAK